MAVSATPYGLATQSLLEGEIDLSSGNIKGMLCTSDYTPDLDAHRYKSSVTGEVTGTGYTAGGLALTSVSVTYDSGTNQTAVDADPLVWEGAILDDPVRYLVLYDGTAATDGARPLIGVIDFGTDLTQSGGNFTVTFDDPVVVASVG